MWRTATMPLIAAGSDKTQARRLQRLAEQGHFRRIHSGIYTDDLVQPLESIVRRELYALCPLVAGDSIISHRSALESKRPTAAGNVFLTGPYRRDRSEEHTSELQSRENLVCRLLLEKK